MSKCGNCCYGVMTGPNRMFCSAQDCLCEEVFDCEDYDPIVKPQINADHIRSMSDEELANWYFNEFFPKAPYCTKEECFPEDDCVECLLNWLRQECE